MATQPQIPIIPPPPRPPASLPNQDYFNQLTRWLENEAQQLSGILYLRGSGLFLPGLPTSGYGLRTGEVFSNAGVLTIVREGDIWMGSFAVSVEIGTLTVTV